MTQGITTYGWFFLVFGWEFILTLTIYCFSRVLFGKKPEVVLEAGGREQWGSRIGLILAVADPKLARKLAAFRKQQTAKVRAMKLPK